MPLRQSDLNELFDVNGMAFKHRNEQLRNDLDAFYAGAKNAALSGVAGLAGTVGDFESLVKTLVQAKQGYILPNKTVAPTSERLAEMMGADLNSPSGWAGLIGVPDLGDIAKLGVLGVAKAGSKVAKKMSKKWEAVPAESIGLSNDFGLVPPSPTGHIAIKAGHDVGDDVVWVKYENDEILSFDSDGIATDNAGKEWFWSGDKLEPFVQ